MSRQVQPGYRVARLIASALPGGVFVMWVVGWVITGGGETGVSPEAFPADVAFWVWAGLALACLAGALAFRGRALGIAERARREADGAYPPEALGEVQTNLVIAWALLEGPAILSGVLFVLLAEPRILWTAVPVYLLGIAATFPRAEWFGEDARRSGLA